MKHSLEISLLLMACTVELTEEKKAQITQFLGQHKLDWNRLYKLAARHKVTPFLYRTLQANPFVAESFLTTLQNDCRTIATDNLLKLHQYRLIAKQFSDNAINCVPLKGIYLAANCYPDPSLRPIGDLDVLVAKEDVFKTIRLLEADDYQVDQKSTLYMKHDQKVIFSDLYEVSLMKPFFNNSYFDLDLHWEFVCFNKQYKVYTVQEVLSSPTLYTEYQIVLLVAHHGITAIWQTINYINDLYFLINGRVIDWAWLLQELRRNGLERIFLSGLLWCQQIWNLPLPPHIQDMLVTQPIQSVANAYEKNWETSEPLSSSSLILNQLTFFFTAQTQLSKKLKILVTFCTSRVIRYSTFKIGQRIIYVPKQFGIITFFIRGFRSLLRFIPALREPLR